MINKLALHFGGRVMFNEVSFRINETDKIGLTGRNGAGKSTLLKIFVGLQKADIFEVAIPKGTTIGYLPQELHVSSDKSVIEETKSAFNEIIALEEELNHLQHELETRTDYESDNYMKLIEDFTEKQSLLSLSDHVSIEEKIEKVLKGLGFKITDFQQPVKAFSGGWQMRIELAKILLRQPSLILLDEPTNHLDIESVTWLESFLKNYPGAIMLVSHDKTFLDTITNRTIEISRGEIEDYKASYSDYILQRAERKELMVNAQKNQEREMAQMQRNIDRFRAKASKATFAQSLIKKLDKIEKIEIESEDVAAMKIRFPKCVSSGITVVQGKNINKSYGDKKVIQNENFEIIRGEKIAFVGKNGMGKTTLSRMIAGDLDFEGILKLGHNVNMGYYAQHQTENLQPKNNVLEEMELAAPANYEGNLRTLLGAFLFSGDDVYKKVKVLSGGEKSRLAMAKLLLQPLNFLILDEPTNHLDMIAKDVLKQAMQQFEGTIIVVSHDREFLQGLTNKTFEFTESGIKEHLGEIQEFLRKKEVESFRLLESEKIEKDASTKIEKNEKQEKDDKKNYDTLKNKLKNEVKKAETELLELEQKIQAVEVKINDPFLYKDLEKQDTIFENYEKMKAEYQKIFEQWEIKVSELENIKNEIT